MDPAITGAVLGFLGGMLSAVVGFAGVWLSQRNEDRRRERSRDEQLAASLRTERAQIYGRFIEHAHETAHLLGRAAGAAPALEPVERQNARWTLDRTVAKDLLVLATVASEGTLNAAGAVRAALRRFRDEVYDRQLVYDTSEGSAYLDAYRPYQQARTAMLSRVRAEVLDLSAPAAHVSNGVVGQW